MAIGTHVDQLCQHAGQPRRVGLRGQRAATAGPAAAVAAYPAGEAEAVAGRTRPSAAEEAAAEPHTLGPEEAAHNHRRTEAAEVGRYHGAAADRSWDTFHC